MKGMWEQYQYQGGYKCQANWYSQRFFNVLVFVGEYQGREDKQEGLSQLGNQSDKESY